MLTRSLLELLLAALAFVGSHLGLSSRALRPRLVARLGERRFLMAYSLLAALTLGWLILSYARAPLYVLWPTAAWNRWLALALMPVALVLLAGSVLQRNPTALGGDPRRLPSDSLGITAITRHPMMWAFALWASVHLLSNGDIASLIFFGAFLVLSLGGTRAIDAKLRRRDPAGFAQLATRTSNLLLAALLAGRARLSPRRRWPALATGLALYLLLLLAHPYLFGVSALG